MKVRFTADYDFKPSPNVTQAYRAGQEAVVTTPCAEKAIALGRAVEIDAAPPSGIADTIKRKRKAKPNG